MKVKAVSPWYGSNRTLAANVGAALKGYKWVGIPLAGGMAELRYVSAPSVVVSDKHAHVINLATVVACEDLKDKLKARLDATPFHPLALKAAQERCRFWEAEVPRLLQEGRPLGYLDWAYDYFLASWMGRNGRAGTKGEFDSGLSVRWDGGGGDSATRLRNATHSLDEWCAIMRGCTFVCEDCFDMLDKVNDFDDCAVYLDPPFPETGDDYKHGFTLDDHKRLAAKLNTFTRCRVVVRYYDHPLVRKLYPKRAWTWNRFVGRTANPNGVGDELLLVNDK